MTPNAHRILKSRMIEELLIQYTLWLTYIIVKNFVHNWVAGMNILYT